MNRNNLLDECFRRTSELPRLIKEAYDVRRKNFPDTIFFSMPGMIHFESSFYNATDPYRFPAISITGGECSLNCEHCKGRILEYMFHAVTPKRLLRICSEIRARGGSGCLISGGSLKNGSVPLTKFIPVIKYAKKNLGLKVVVHTGIVTPRLAEALSNAGVDAAMIDIIGSDETLREICHLNVGCQVFNRSLSLLEEYAVPVVPHIVVGIHRGRLKGEKEALKIIMQHEPTAIVIVVFIPMEGTPLVNAKPPDPLSVLRVILAARLMMPDKPLILGCARPLGTYRSRIDVLAVKAGVNGMAYPSEEGYQVAEKMKLDIRFSDECCSLIYKEMIGE